MEDPKEDPITDLHERSGKSKGSSIVCRQSSLLHLRNDI